MCIMRALDLMFLIYFFIDLIDVHLIDVAHAFPIVHFSVGNKLLFRRKTKTGFQPLLKFLSARSNDMRKINTLNLWFGLSKTKIEIILKDVVLIIDRLLQNIFSYCMLLNSTFIYHILLSSYFPDDCEHLFSFFNSSERNRQREVKIIKRHF